MRTAIILGSALLILCGSVSAASDASKIELARQLAAGYVPAGARAASGIASLTVESKVVQPGESARVGIYIRNDIALWAVVVPLVIREIDPGSFWTAAKAKFDHTARINGYMDGTYEGSVLWPEIVHTYPGAAPNRRWIGPLDYISPDFILMVKGRITEGDLPPGDDVAPDSSGKPSIVIDMTVNNVPGRFEIDTTMISPANHLAFAPSDWDPVAGREVFIPDFTKGIITIAGSPSVSDDQDTTVTQPKPPDTLVSLPDTVPSVGPVDTTVVPEEPPDTLVSVSDTVPGVHPTDPAGIVNQVRSSPKGGPADADSQLRSPTWKGENDPKGSPSDNHATQIKSACVNYPNPFNAGTVIRYALEESGDVSLSVYNLLGQRVMTLVDGRQAQGEHLAAWNGSDTHGVPVPSGIYLYRFQTEKQTAIGKMMLVR
jgi:hypothetical protein